MRSPAALRHSLHERLHREARAYAGDADRPLAGHATRLATATLSAPAAADFLQFARAALQRAAGEAS
ncbi:hypothetical protein ACFYNO_28910 [Kitasatospora sp. NPDC006697]|uniref:hypothetical protein n=1 Tax=Kitasatospora sp. NPDC006697 TaxID=3364020 RepID=UPI003683CCD7